MWHTLGHQNQKILLENALKNHKFSHAYLFAGPSMVGKKTLAIEFAKKILEVDEHANFNPDLILIGSEQNKIEDMRQLISDLSLRPYQYKYKIAIIDDFEKVTEQAANSILKTLEEPSPTTIIFLITSNIKAVLPTIVSRAQVLNFNRVGESEFPAGSKSFLNLVDGRIGKVMTATRNKNFAEQLKERAEALKKIKQMPTSGRLIAIKEYSEQESAELANIFEDWLDSEHYEIIRSRPGAYKNLVLLIESIFGLRQNFNKKLVLQKLFLNVQ